MSLGHWALSMSFEKMTTRERIWTLNKQMSFIIFVSYCKINFRAVTSGFRRVYHILVLLRPGHGPCCTTVRVAAAERPGLGLALLHAGVPGVTPSALGSAAGQAEPPSCGIAGSRGAVALDIHRVWRLPIASSPWCTVAPRTRDLPYPVRLTL